MDSLQDAMCAVLCELPHLIVTKLVEEKLAAQKITLSKRRLKELVTHILKEKTGPLSVPVGKGGPIRTVTIEFTDDDADSITRRCDKLLESLPKLIDGLADEMSAKTLALLKKRWPQEARQQQKDISSFQKRLHQRWGPGLDGLRMLVTIAREFGSNFPRDMQDADHRRAPVTSDVLVRLHVRACQITDEIICLLSHGFADGAMARWRTLQEIAAVCFLIGEHGDDLAERYKAHDIVETRKAALQYEKYWQQLGQEAITDSDLAEIEKRYTPALAQYGRGFKTQYGWAAKHLNKSSPTIADIQGGRRLITWLPITGWRATTFMPMRRGSSSNSGSSGKGTRSWPDQVMPDWPTRAMRQHFRWCKLQPLFSNESDLGQYRGSERS